MKNHRLGRWVPFFSGYPILPDRYLSGIRSGTRRRSARWGISSPPYPFGIPSHGFPPFPSVIYRICWDSIRILQPFPRSKGRRVIPHGGACPPLLFRRENRRVSRGFRCPSPATFFRLFLSPFTGCHPVNLPFSVPHPFPCAGRLRSHLWSLAVCFRVLNACRQRSPESELP